MGDVTGDKEAFLPGTAN